jgi:hypothetical protein
VKPFPKTPEKIVTVTIDEDGGMTYLATDSADIFMDLGTTITRRASHVEPDTLWLRWTFRILRLFGGKNRIAEWTRGWRTTWRIDTSPVGGPVLRWKHTNNWRSKVWPDKIAKYQNRQDAIDAEIVFLNDWFVERGVKIR